MSFQCILKGINDGHLHSVEEDKIVDVAQSLIDEEDLMELRRKKTLLERVMARLRELITASQQTGDTNKLQITLLRNNITFIKRIVNLNFACRISPRRE